MTVEIFANQPTTTVSSGGTTAPAQGTSQTWTVASSTSFPAASSSAVPPTLFHVCDIASGKSTEIIAVTNVSGTTWTVTRGAEGTAPIAHTAGFTIQQVVTAGFFGNVSQIPASSQVFNVKYYGATGNGSTNDTAAVQAAITKALAVATTGLSAVFFPAGQYLINSSLNCTSATGSAPGNGVVLVGADRQASQIVKNFNGALCTWNGNGGPDTGNPSAFGGLRDITLNGNSFTGPLIQTNSANRMFFINAAFDNNPDLTMDLNTMEDSYWVGCTSNNCGSTTAPVIKIYGSSVGTSNMLWFTQLRIESFLDGAVWIQQGSGNTGGNNGFFFSQCKFETTTINGDFIVADGYTQQLMIDQCFFALDAFNGGYSTAANCVKFGASTAVGGNQFTLSNCWIHAATSTLNSVININGAAGAMTGPITLSSIFSDQVVTTAVCVVNGCANVYLNIRGIAVDGSLFSGDGSYYASGGNNYLEIVGSSFGFLNFNDLGFIPAMPLFNVLGSGVSLSGATSATGAIVFGAQSAAEAGNGIGGSAFIVTDNDKVFTRNNYLDNGSGAAHVVGPLATGSSASTVALVTNGTIPSTTSFQAVSSGSNLTGIIISTGAIDGQTLIVANTTAHTIVFAGSATSHVSVGASGTIPSLEGGNFSWSSNTSLWYPLRSGAA